MLSNHEEGPEFRYLSSLTIFQHSRGVVQLYVYVEISVNGSTSSPMVAMAFEELRRYSSNLLADL